MLSPLSLPSGKFLLITDELPSPADFLLHRALMNHSKDMKENKTIIISVSEGLPRWKAIAARNNFNLQNALDSGSVQFIDLLSQVEPSTDPPNPSVLRSTHATISSKIAESDAAHPPLIILDDITTLEWIGFSTLELSRFVRALNVACIPAKATLIIRHHIVSPDDPDGLLSRLRQLCAYHIEVRALASGRSGSVSGKIAVHPGPVTVVSPPGTKLIPRSLALQYRLTDSGAVFFEKGTSGGVL